MDMRDLRAFVAVAEEQHFRRAAERLSISQPPLSQRIRALEQELGVALLERTTRRVELTASGTVFLEHARALLQGLASAAKAAQRAHEGEIGRVELGYIQSTSYILLPALLKACRAALPGIELHLHELAVDRQHDWLLDGRIDLALARLPVEHPRLRTTTLVEEPMVVAIPEGHALLRHAVVDVSRLAREPVIGYPPGGEGTLHSIVTRMFAQAGVDAQFIHVAGTLHTALGLVRAGEGVAVVPRSLQVVRLHGVEYRPLRRSTAVARLGFAWRDDRRSPAVAAVIDLALRARVGAAVVAATQRRRA